MKPLAASFVFWAALLGTNAQMVIDPYQFAVVAGDSCDGYVICQEFEGTGYDNSETWTEANSTIDEDYTTTVLSGSESLYISSSGFSTSTYVGFSSGQEFWLYFMLHPVAFPANGFQTSLVGLRKGADGRFDLKVLSDGTFQVAGNLSGTLSCSDKMSTGTTYHCWAYFNTTSSPETVELAYSTTGTKPSSGGKYASGTVETTDGTTISRLYLSNGGGGSSPIPTMIFDRIRLDDSEIGSNP